MLNTLQKWTACFAFVFFLGHSALLSYVNQAFDTAEKHHRCIRGNYNQKKLDTQRRIRLLKLFTDIHKTTLKNQSVPIFTAYCIGRQLCPTHCDPTDCSLPVFFAHGISQARILELPFLPPANLPDPGIECTSPVFSCIGRQILYHCTAWEALSPVGSVVKNPLPVQETWVWSLGWENSLE